MTNKRQNIQKFKNYMIYEVYGIRYCRTPNRLGLSRKTNPKIPYDNQRAALDGADNIFDKKGYFLYPYQHYDHWHLTSNIPLLTRFYPYAAFYHDKSNENQAGLRPETWKKKYKSNFLINRIDGYYESHK